MAGGQSDGSGRGGRNGRPKRWKEDIWKEIRERVSCADVAYHYGYTPNSGGFIPCPFHHEHTGSCKLYPGDGGFHCFGCGAHGDVIDFTARLTGLSRIDAARELDRLYSLGLEFGHEKPGRRKFDVDGYMARYDEADKAVREMDVLKILELMRHHRVDCYERVPGHILDTGDAELIRSYLVGNVYVVGGQRDYIMPTNSSPSTYSDSMITPEWSVWLRTIDRNGWTFGEELEAVTAIHTRQGIAKTKSMPCYWKNRLNVGLLHPNKMSDVEKVISQSIEELEVTA